MSIAIQGKKLVLVLTTCRLMTGTEKEAYVTQKALKVILDHVPYTCYLMQFRSDKRSIIQALINLCRKTNAITLAYAKQLGFRTQKTDVGAQKIADLSLKTFEMIIARIQVINKLCIAHFFQKIILLADTSIEVALEMPFLTLSNADI